MAQETWGLKLDLDLKEKVQEIVKNDFDSSKEFLEQLVNMYELHQLKQGENVLTSEIEELESLTRRINNVFINANAKINTMLADKDDNAARQVELKGKLIERLQGDIATLEEEREQISSINDSLTLANTDYINQVNQLTKSTQTLEDLVTEYKEKNDTLTGLLAEYKADREQNKSLQEENRELQKKLQELNAVATEQAKQILESGERLREQSTKHENSLQELLTKQADELDTTRRKAEIDANLSVLALQQEHQAKVQALQDKHNADIEQYQSKYRELLEQLEQQKKTTAKPKNTKTKKENTTQAE
ncbi:hypothetical protein PBV87_00075 [Niameybacter massiliensis]|uniref:Uncharacterized protein n=1 Tax=Holtiella tumoricola TaxID=3018743 RepID=A0AA42DJ66_9FIRM|nr:hypothetical protein [Holtiella tumoricola]MDA3729908.1 hypothetical protein [Holtiella tumoricola]